MKPLPRRPLELSHPPGTAGLPQVELVDSVLQLKSKSGESCTNPMSGAVFGG